MKKQIIWGLIFSMFLSISVSAEILDSRMMYHLQASFRNPDRWSERFQKEEKIPEKWTYVIAPHPDDEINCCARTIKSLKRENKPVKIVYLTHGDSFDQEVSGASRLYGAQRRKDSENAMNSLGFKREDLFFLNFPAGYLADLNEDYVIMSAYTGQRRTNSSSYKPNRLYNIQTLWKVLGDIFVEFPPETIYMPDESSHHLDHFAVPRTVKKALELKNIPFPALKGYKIYGKEGERQKDLFNWKKRFLRFLVTKMYHSNHREFLEDFATYKETFIDIK